MKIAHDSGFQVASHTYSHKIPNDISEFKNVLTQQDDFIEKVTGDRPRYFRSPKGECNDEQKKSLDKWGYRAIKWDTDTNDWDLIKAGSEEQRVKDSIDYLRETFAEEKDSYLILLHDSQNYTVKQIAPWIIEKSGMKEKGYRFVTVAECLGDKSDMYISGKTYDNANTFSNSNNNNTIINNNNNISSNENQKQSMHTGEKVIINKIDKDISDDAQLIKFTFIYAFLSTLLVIFYLF